MRLCKLSNQQNYVEELFKESKHIIETSKKY